jgi:DDE superfamily endonuclease
MVSVVSRWLQRSWICVADGGYGNAKFGWACRRHGVSLGSRLPWKANLYDFVPTAPPRRLPGRPRTKGVRQLSMQQRVETLKFESGQFHIFVSVVFADLFDCLPSSFHRSHLASFYCLVC